MNEFLFGVGLFTCMALGLGVAIGFIYLIVTAIDNTKRIEHLEEKIK